MKLWIKFENYEKNSSEITFSKLLVLIISTSSNFEKKIVRVMFLISAFMNEEKSIHFFPHNGSWNGNLIKLIIRETRVSFILPNWRLTSWQDVQKSLSTNFKKIENLFLKVKKTPKTHLIRHFKISDSCLKQCLCKIINFIVEKRKK